MSVNLSFKKSANKRKESGINQFRIIFWGQMVSVVGINLSWPYLTIYLRENLGLSLTTITGLITLESFMTILATILISPFMDRFGRKPVMVLSLLINSLSFLVMIWAESLLAFAIIISIRGLFTPLFQVGTNTMVVDITPEDRRFEAFSLTRTSINIGFAFGPAVGGFIAAESFRLCLILSGVMLGILTVVMMLLLKESLPERSSTLPASGQIMAGYDHIMKDKTFLFFLLGDILVMIAMVNMFSLLSVYAKENYALPQSRYGILMTINAVMAATLQLPVTKVIKKKPPFVMLTISALFYAFGLGSVVLGSKFFHFSISMVIVTGGELILMPTAISVVARIAPQALRARYMGFFGLTMGIARALGPLIGGVLNDQMAPVAIWYGSMLMGLLSAGVYLALHRSMRDQAL